MLEKAGVCGIVFLTILLSIGCSGEGIFENPDSIKVTSLDAIQGKRGHVITVNLSGAEEATKQAVLEIQDKEVSDATLYVIIEGNDSGMSGLVDLFKIATNVAVVPDVPKDTKPWTNLILNLGDGGSPFSGYLQVATPAGTVYLALQGTLSQEKRAWFLGQVTKPPETVDTTPAKEPPKPPIDTTPASVIDISYYADSDCTMPLVDEAVVGGTIYTKVVFSKDVPIIVADDSSARPSISSRIGLEDLRFQAERFQYRMRPWGTDLQSGDAKPFRDTKNTFICKYRVRADDFRETFRTYTGSNEVSGPILRILYFVHTDEIPTNVGETIVNWQPQDFVGQVYTTRPSEYIYARTLAIPVAGVTVTIVSGPRSGESILTDINGRYRFLNVDGDNLHLRTEKDHFEPKEAIVHRHAPTSLPDGSVPNYHKDPQKEPGNILIGQRWPDEVRPILEETLLVHDLLYIEGGADRGNNPLGYYGSGVVVVFSNGYDKQHQFSNILNTFAHEIAHAHQHAALSIDGSMSLSQWERSPEGRAYAEAKQKDFDLGKKLLFDTRSYYADNLFESAAQFCVNYWHRRREWELWYTLPHQSEGNMEELAPNRFKWAEEWLEKK